MQDNNIPKSCHEIALLSEKKQYRETNFWGKLRLKMHILYCERRRNYEKSNRKLSNILNNAKLDCLTVDEINELEKIIK